MKKIMMIVGALFFALIVAIVSIPFFVDVDKYRPLIVDQVNQRINGKFEMGKLSLTLWGKIKVHAESIKMTVNGFSDPLVSAETFFIEIPVSSILAGKPEVVAVMVAPKIHMEKNAAGKINAMNLMVAASGQNPPAASTPPVTTTAAPASGSAANTTQVPAIVAGASLGIRIDRGDLEYVDKVAKSNYAVKGLEVEARNLGLGSAMSVRILAPTKGSSPTMDFEGPVELNAHLTPTLAGGTVKSAVGDAELDATGLAIKMKNGSFVKSDKMPMKVTVKLQGDEREILFKTLEAQFHEFKISGNGRVTVAPMTSKFAFNSDGARLEKVADFVPMVAAYDMKGVAHVNVRIDQAPESIKVNGDLDLADGSIFMKDFFKAPLLMKMKAGFSENSFNLVQSSISGPDSDLQIQGNVRNFMAPQFSIGISGKSINADKLLVMMDPKKAAQIQTWFSINEAYAAAAAPSDQNPMLAMANDPKMGPMLKGSAGTLTAQLGRFTVMGVNIEQISAKANLQNLVLKLQEASLKTFSGVVKSNGEFDLKSPPLNFKTQGTVAGLSAKDAFAQYFPAYKNTIEGIADASWNVSGGLYPPASRVKALKGGAKLLVHDGALKTVDFQGSINTAMQKVPFLKDKKPLEVDNGFKTMSAEVKFDNGTTNVDPMEIVPRGRGFNIKGKSKISENLEQESFFDIYDPQNLLPKELSQPGKPAIAMRMFGSMTGPKTDYEYTVKKLIAGAGKAAAKGFLEKMVGGAVGGATGGDAGGGDKKDVLKNVGDQLKKKFHF